MASRLPTDADISEVMRAMGRKGAQKRWDKATDEQRRQQGEMLAKARKRARKANKTKA